MPAIPTILVPFDGRLRLRAALPVARGLAGLTGATVTLLHVGPQPMRAGALLDRTGLRAEEAAGLIIDQAIGAPASVVLREASARNAAFIILGRAGGEDELSPATESAVRDVVLGAPCPVVLVPPGGGEGWALRQLVLPHDGAPTSAAAFAPAAKLAARAGAELVVLHAPPSDAQRPTEPGSFAAPRYLDHPHQEWASWTREFLHRARCACPQIEVGRLRLVVGHGEPGAAILDFLGRNGGDLVVLAWHGRLDPARAQTMRRVVLGAPCPVIIFRVQP